MEFLGDAVLGWAVADMSYRRFGQTPEGQLTDLRKSVVNALALAKVARQVTIPVATGEHMANRVMFKQFLQADALQIVQIDASRVAGVNENVAILLLAAKFGVPVCPHAGGVGLCEVVQHLSMFDYLAVSARSEGRYIEFVDHLHEHFVTPVDVRGGRYRAPLAPGSGAEMLEASRLAHTYEVNA